MPERNHKILLLALGNDILGDDAVSLFAARELGKRFHDQLDILEAPIAGFALLDLLAGYEKVLILDSIVAPGSVPGAVRELTINDLSTRSFSSPHYVGLSEVLELANRLDIPFPNEIRILAIDVCDPYRLHEGLTEEVNAQLPKFVDEAENILLRWIPRFAEHRNVLPAR